MKKKSILIIEDNIICQGNVKRVLKKDYTLFLAETKKQGLEILKKNFVDIILLDLDLPDSTTGPEIVSDILSTYPNNNIIVLTSNDDPDISAEVIKKGAKDYIQKNKFFANNTLLLNKMNSIFEVENYKKLNEIKTEQIAQLNKNIFIPSTPEYKKAYINAEIAFKGFLSLLIYGETGTGKSMLVRSIHQKLMPDKPLVCLDCGAIPDSLIESELFGYEKGAFTGAENSKTGKIELANDGILFLDEITNSSIEVQKKLLRVLQEKKICRLGSIKEICVDFMLVTATNKNLLQAINEGKFKEDFYYRIKQIEISLPPLRKDKNVLKQFIYHFIIFYNARYKINFEPDKYFWDIMLSKNWPGNLRELDLDIQKIVFTHSMGQSYKIHSIEKASCEKKFIAPNTRSIKKTVRLKEKDKLVQTLTNNNFNIAAAARELGIPRTTLQSKIKKYKIS